MVSKKNLVLLVFCAVLLNVSACSRQQSDWQKARETNSTDAYEQYLKKYPAGEFSAQAQARAKELYEERDWQKARDADTPEAYQAFLKQYPEGKWTEEARIRVENFTLANAPPTTSTQAPAPATADAGGDKPLAAIVNPAPPHAAAPAVIKPQPPAPPPAAGKPTVASADSGAYAVQLGAFKSGAEAAHQHWAQLKKQYPGVLNGLAPHVVTTKTPSATLYRLQSSGLSEKRARSVCDQLKAKSQACVLVVPAA